LHYHRLWFAQRHRQGSGAGLDVSALKPGGRVVILEFSHPIAPGLKPVYDLYSFAVLPIWASWWPMTPPATAIWPNPSACTRIRILCCKMMETAGFERCQYFNLTGGVVAVHRGYKF
jgi:demethylmenaquinone methyltransferase/2-methoxy-6-polyprenyl-1,4-benzoquinol methylase